MFNIFDFNAGGIAANTYVVADEVSGDAALFDPSCPVDEMADFFAANDMILRYIILTHAHYDHMLTLNETRERYPDVPVCVGDGDEDRFNDAKKSCAYLFGVGSVDFGHPDRLLREGDFLPLGDGGLTVLSTPGHAPGCCCFTVDDIMITGDTLFAGSIGRFDFVGGDYDTISRSLLRLMSLDTDYTIYPGHGPASTISHERKYNPFIRQII